MTLPRAFPASRRALLRHAAAFAIAAVTVTGLACKEGGGSAKSSGGGGSGGKKVIAVIPKGSTHQHWKKVDAGAEEAGKELGVEIAWKAPLTENDRAQQKQIIEQFVADKVDAIVVAPLDSQAMLQPVQKATAAKIPVVIIDSGLDGQVGKDFVSVVSTDNHKGGVMCGEAMGKVLGGKGKVVMLRYQEGSASTKEREDGFMEAIKKFPDIKVISDNQYGGATPDSAHAKAQNMLDVLREADGVFACNESTTYGMLLALREAGLNKKIKFVGFDASEPLVKALRDGDIQALVAQNPRKMGYLGVKEAVAAIKGEKVDPSIDTGAVLITPDNVDSAEIKALLGS